MIESRFLFAGVTERWEQSICVYHSLMAAHRIMLERPGIFPVVSASITGTSGGTAGAIGAVAKTEQAIEAATFVAAVRKSRKKSVAAELVSGTTSVFLSARPLARQQL